MLEPELRGDEVQGLGGVQHVTEQLGAWDPFRLRGARLFEAVQERLVRQLADDDELVVQDFDAFDRKHERMANLLDPSSNALDFLAGVPVVDLPVNKLDGLQQPSGASAFQTSPNPPEPNRSINR